MAKADLPKATVVGVGVVIQKDNKFLLVKEKTDLAEIGKIHGMYSFPSGFVKPGELPQDAARREAKEETGLDAELENIIGFYLIKGALGIAYRAKLISKTESEIDKDIAETSWFSEAEVRKLNLRPANLQILQDYLAGKTFPLNSVTDCR